MKANRLLSFGFAIALSGCVSDGYKEFYHEAPGLTPERLTEMRETPAPAMPLLQRASDKPQVIADAFARRGYLAVGYSSFNGGAGQSEQNALRQGAKVGADLVVVVNPQYTGSQSTVIPITTPTTQTSYTSGNATAYGSGGSATAYGNAVTTTYGSQTNYIPISVDRYEYGALYFVKRHYIFGANFRPLNDAERQKLQTNRGAVVTLVVDGAPAFMADILTGDVVTAIDGQPITDQEQLSAVLKDKKGQQVKVTMIRNGSVLEKPVALRN